MYSLTPAEIEIFEKGATDPNIFMDYWFRKPGQEHGWMFDANFEEAGKWQETMCMASQPFIVAICGIACASIDSRVYDTELKRYISFEELLKLDRAPIVLARGLHGWKKVQATHPFLKGKAKAVKITLSDGNSIKVSLDHRFLTATQGFVHTRDLKVGVALIAPHTSSLLSPSDKEDVQNCLEKPSNYQGRYSFHCHQYGERLLSQSKDVQVSVPLQNDVQQSNHSISSFLNNLRGQEQKHKYHPSSNNKDHQHKSKNVILDHRESYSFVPQSSSIDDVLVRDRNSIQGHQQFSDNSNQEMQDVSKQVDICPVLNLSSYDDSYQKQYSNGSSSSNKKDIVELLQDSSQLPLWSRIGQQVLEVHSDPFQSPCDNTLNYYTPIITNIEDIGEIDLYDIHVPQYENYVMEGVVSKNTGKTLGIGMGGAYHGAMSQHFKFLNVGPTAWQSNLMFRGILEQAEDTPFENLIAGKPSRPWPSIRIEFMVDGIKHSSLLEFMSLGEKGTADHIFSYRGDWINIDEAGKIDGLNDVVTNLVTRLTGSTAEGRKYLGRLSLTSNPWENIDMWTFYDSCARDAQDGLVFNIDTTANKNVSEKQVRFALKMIPEELHDKFMTGRRPEGKGNYFSSTIVNPCENRLLSQIIQTNIENGVQGYEAQSLPHMGYFYVHQPRILGREYIILGDPGTGTAPARNAPCIICYDVTDAPSSVYVHSFWWGNGGGSIMPFVTRMFAWLDEYQPTILGVDNTGPQKNTAELLELEYIEGQNKSVAGITGMDFSSGKRMSYLVALRLMIESRAIQWPHIITGIGAQLKNYDPILDRAQGKLAQDIVATMAMGAFAIRAYYNFNTEEDSESDGKNRTTNRETRRYSRTTIRTRSRTIGKRIPVSNQSKT